MKNENVDINCIKSLSGKLVDQGYCADWDDPRLFTLTALRRRGFPAEAINNFCAQMGVTGAQMVIDPSALEAVVRNFLNHSAPRTMVVLRPLKVTIKSSIPKKKISVPNFPDAPEKGSHEIDFSDTIYIEQEDFMESGEKGYRRLTKDQPVGLRYAGYVLKFLKVVKKDGKGNPIEIEVEATPVDKVECKPKAFIHWVDGSSKTIGNNFILDEFLILKYVFLLQKFGCTKDCSSTKIQKMLLWFPMAFSVISTRIP